MDQGLVHPKTNPIQTQTNPISSSNRQQRSAIDDFTYVPEGTKQTQFFMNHSCPFVVQFGNVLDKFGVVSAHFGTIWAQFGTAKTPVKRTKSTFMLQKQRLFTKSKPNIINGYLNRQQHSAFDGWAYVPEVTKRIQFDKRSPK